MFLLLIMALLVSSIASVPMSFGGVSQSQDLFPEQKTLGLVRNGEASWPARIRTINTTVPEPTHYVNPTAVNNSLIITEGRLNVPFYLGGFNE